VSTIAQYRTKEIPQTITAFRELDYTDDRLYKSGLLKETIKSHFWLIESSSRSLDSVYIAMNKSIDHLIKNLLSDDQKLNGITEYLFKLLEERSLFTSSEYLAIKVLNEVNCTIDDDLAMQLDSYHTMKIGNMAPNIQLSGDLVDPGYNKDALPKKLSDLKSKYVAVVFGASWCPKCVEELPKIAKSYTKWKAQGALKWSLCH
jgi:hypothetical protein